MCSVGQTDYLWPANTGQRTWHEVAVNMQTCTAATPTVQIPEW